MSASTHDLIFSVGGVIFAVALLPAVRKKTVMPLSTCLVTASVCLILSLNYLTMAYWYAFALESCIFLLWSYLTGISLKARSSLATEPHPAAIPN